MRSATSAAMLALLLLAASLAGCAGSEDGEIVDDERDEIIADLNERLNESAEAIVSLEDQLVALQAEADLVPGLKDEASQLTGRVLMLESNITHLNAEIIVLERLYSEAQNESVSLASELAQSQAQAEALGTQIDALQADVEEDAARIEELQEQLDSLNSTIENLEAQIETYDVIIANLEATRDQLRDRVAQLEEDIVELQSEVESLEEAQLECDSSTYQDGNVCRSRGIIWVNMPFEDGHQANITQSHHGYYSHNDAMLYAVDFPTPENTSITAALPGIVIQVVENYTGGCPSSECEDQSNFVIIDHGDSTYGMYAHLTHNGALVDVGDSIHQGQQIALSGNTGWSTGPHLHFEVKDIYGQSIPIRFHELANISRGVAHWGASVASANIETGQGLNHTHSVCDEELFLAFGILLDSDIPCSLAQLDTPYSLQGWTYGPAGNVGVAQYDIGDGNWIYSCYSANANGWFNINLEFDSAVHEDAVYFMVYSADSDCVSYQAWDQSIGLWLE